MITRIDGAKCHLRKFTASQFRSKVYQVPQAACYPLSHQDPQTDYNGPVRGFDIDSSDEEADSVSDVDVPLPPVVPPAPPIEQPPDLPPELP